MDPTELEQTLCSYFGENSITITQEDDTVIAAFSSTGEQRVNVVNSALELISNNENWEKKDVSVTDDMWVLEYTP